ncbi:MAG: hypothetical protein VW970_01860 [Candidatus Poseidoniales archaeon]
MNGFTAYVVTYSVLGLMLSYYLVYIGKKIDKIRIRIREVRLILDDKNPEK